MYKAFSKEVEFKKYLHGVSDAGTRLLFKFRSGTHGSNEELSRHRGRNGRTECVSCDDECENIVHVLWECAAYKDGREQFMIKLRSTLGEAFKDFEALDNIERASFVLGCELWTESFDSILALVNEYIIDLWDVRKVKLYGEPCSTQPQSLSSAWDLRDGTVVGGQRKGKFGKFSHSGRVTGKLSTCITDDSCKTGDRPTLGAWSTAGLLGQPLDIIMYIY